MIWIVNFPLPPSVNDYLMPVAGGWSVNKKGRKYQKGRWVKTEPHKLYMQRCHEWKLLNGEAWYKIRAELKAQVLKARQERRRVAFQVDTYFAFHDERIWTVNNIPERLDADNRLKPCRDALADILEIDDKYFFSGFFEKVSTKTKEEECTYMRITPMIPRTLESIKKMITATS